MTASKSTKRLVVLLALILAITMMPTSAFAAKAKLARKAPAKSTYSMYVGKTATFKVKNTYGKKVKWYSSKKTVATVSSKGKVYAKKAGTSYITAKTSKGKVKWKLTVKNVPQTSLARTDWNPEVKSALNELAKNYGIKGKYYSDSNYVVFDFDNTCSIFDMQEQLSIYQLSKMAFAFKPGELEDILKTEIDNDYAVGRGTDYCTNDASYQDWIDDITGDYNYLYQKYGPFKAAGVSAAVQKQLAADVVWQDFAVKMRAMYDLIFDNESADVAYPWILYWFTGMTRAEAYNLAYASHSYYKTLNTSEVDLTAPDQEAVANATGRDTTYVQIKPYTYTSGVTVSANIQELWKVLYNNGIDIYVCSASATDNIMAAIDSFGIHDYLSGLLAMTVKVDANGKYTNAYDYETGYLQIPIKGKKGASAWKQGTLATKAQTQGQGKVTAINNAIAAQDQYKTGPIAAFMDSTGDCAFTTEYDTLKLVVCFNRASRKVTDGGGVIAELAVYQADTLGWESIAEAQKTGDTYYVLQGRDENNLRGFRASRKTLRYGKSSPLLFRDKQNYSQLNYMIQNDMTTAEVINKFFVKTSADQSELGFKYGFWSDYPGYHSISFDN